MIDTHCHLDSYENPLQIANECEELGIVAIGMTNLPSHFQIGYQHLLGFKHVRLALGMHPLNADSHERELPLFRQLLPKTSYVGEVGLDFSNKGIATKAIQLNTFSQILNELYGQKKIVSLHSRKAEKEVLALLIQYRIPLAIFHWYSGPVNLIDEIVKAGYHFSINTAMITSKSGQDIIKRIPIDHILAESDGPFIEINGSPVRPKDVLLVYQYLAKNKNLTHPELFSRIKNNFKTLISRLS
jgi:TatD DNase family protein